jgi:hypothetical protein
MPPHGYHKSVRRYKVEQILTPEHLKEYESMLRDPRTTIRTLHRWLLERGYRVGHAAVGRHRRRFDKDVQAVRRTAMLAEHFADASRGGGLAVLSDATVARFQQVLLERLMRLDNPEFPDAEKTADFNHKQWLELARTITESVAARRSLETLRGEFDDRARKAADFVQKAASNRRKPFDGVAVANAVRRRFGVPLPGETTPGRRGPDSDGANGAGPVPGNN